MYLVVVAVLSVVLIFPEGPVWRGLRDPGQVMAAVAAATLLPAVVAALAGRRALKLLDRHPEDPGEGQAAFGRGMLFVQVLLALGHISVLTLTDWLQLCVRVPVIGQWPIVGGLLAMTPFLLSLVLVWLATYPADRAVRHIALEVYLFRGKPVRPVWPVWEYLVFHLRHQLLFILVPMLLILAARDLINLYQKELRAVFGPFPYLPDLLLGGAAVVVAVIAPALLRYIWDTQRLPDGPLRDRLLHICKKLRLRCREILVWRSGGSLVNAAVMGVVSPLRYVLITDGMLEQMDDTKIEAVFGHEAGHVKRHHILFFLLFAFITGCFVTIFSVYSQQWRNDTTRYQLASVLIGGVLALKWGVLFGWISRRFERQADLFGVRTLALSGVPCAVPCALHHNGAVLPADESAAFNPLRWQDPSESGWANGGNELRPFEPSAAAESKPDLAGPLWSGTATMVAVRKPDVTNGDAPLCATAAHIFGDTLNEVAVLNGIPPEARSWRHGSIASRSRTVQRLAQDPVAARKFERHVAHVKTAILLLAAGTGLWAVWVLKLWTLFGLGVTR